MDTEKRLALIRKIMGKPVPGLIQVSQREVEDIAKEEFNFQPKNIQTEDENVVDMGVTSGKV